MTIGELIAALKLCDPDNKVYFDFCKTFPTKIDSWRGNYSMAALGWDFVARENRRPPSVKDLITELENSTSSDSQYQGYKGGFFKFDKNTVVMIDNYGEYTGTEIVSIDSCDAQTIIVTRYED